MIAGIITLIQALPALIELLNRLGLLVDRMVKYSNQNNLNGWIDSLEKAVDKLEQAKSSEEKLGAAQDLVGIIRGLGP